VGSDTAVRRRPGRRTASVTLPVVVLVAGVLGGCSAVDNLISPSGPAAVSDTALSSPSATPSPTSAAAPASASAASPSAPASASPSISVPSVSITRPPAPTAPPTATGYSYGTAAATVVTAFVRQDVREALSAPLVRSVIRNRTTIGTVAVRRLDEGSVGDIELERSLVEGVVKGLTTADYTVRNRTVADRTVVVAMKKGSTLAAWYHDGYLLEFVTTRDEATVLAFVQAALGA
jgi:hypothetical protein